jgi:hypothetical protein
VQQKLENKEEEEALASRIDRLNHLRTGGTLKPKDGGTSGGGAGAGGGTGLISTWKKLKGKKKKQRNLTAPEISSQDIKAASITDDSHTSVTPTLPSLKESEKKEGGKSEKKDAAKARFGGRKQSKGAEPKDVRSVSSAAEIVFKNDMADSPLLTEETSLSQMSPSLDGSSHTDPAIGNIDGTLSAMSGSKSCDVIVLEPLNLSQTSAGKHSGMSLSQSEPMDEHFNTQSSTSETAISSELAEVQHGNDGWDNKGLSKNEDVHYEGSNFQRADTILYKNFGSKEHRLNLQRVQAFLESSGEMEAADLSVLQEWDGWMVANREIV